MATRIGFLGAGKMAQALANGFINSGLVKVDKILASCIPEDKFSVSAFENLGANVTFSNVELAKNSDVVIVAVKPSVVPTVLQEIRADVTDQNLFISIAMGISLETLQNNLPEMSKVVRVMTNTPVLVEEGTSVFVPGKWANQDDISLTKKLLQTIGSCDEVPENMINAVCGLSGSGPAYMYTIIEGLADGAVRMGLPRDLSYKLAAQTMLGAAKMVLQTKTHPGKLKDDVTSPAGSTAEALFALESAAIRSAMIKAVEAATRKGDEVSSKIK